jgi:hypothetical protein
MEGVGSVGYVAMDNSTMRAVNDVTWQGDYNVHQTAVRHREMKSCVPLVRYGDMVTLQTNELEAVVGKFGIVQFDVKGDKFLVRPERGVQVRDGQTVKYGDSIVLTTSTAMNDSNCGVYGCAVGQIMDGKYQMGAGGSMGGTALKIQWKERTTEVKYGDPFTLSVNDKFAKTTNVSVFKIEGKVNNISQFIGFEDSGTTFGFGPIKACDVKALQGMCGTNCAGILLSPSTNEWHMLTPNEVGAYETGSTQQVAYVKTPKLMLDDPSCAGGVQPVESSIFSSFKKAGELKSSGENQCAPGDMTKISMKEGFGTEKDMKNMQKQSEDWAILDAQYMARTALWSVLLVGIVVAAWKSQPE